MRTAPSATLLWLGAADAIRSIEEAPFITLLGGVAARPLATHAQQAALAVRYVVPAVFENRQFLAAGGLASYGGSLADAYRNAARR